MEMITSFPLEGGFLSRFVIFTLFQENGRHIQITQVAEGGYFLCLRKDAECRQFYECYSEWSVRTELLTKLP